MNYDSVIRKSVIFALIQKSAQILYGIVSVPIILSAIGQTEYGVWIIISQMIALSYFFDMGIGNSFARFLTRFKKKNMSFAINRLFSTSIFFISIISICILIAASLFSHYFLTLYGLSEEQVNSYNNIFIIGLVFAMILFPFRIFTGVYLSYHKLPILDIIVSLIALVKLGLLYFLYKLMLLEINTLVFVVSGMELFSFFLLFLYAKKFVVFQLRISNFNWKLLKIIFSFSIYNIGFSFFVFVLLQYPIFFISKFISVNNVMLFSIPITILVSIGAILGRVGTVFTPISIELRKKIDDKQKLIEMLFKYSNFISLLALVFVIAVYFFGAQIISLWLNDLSTNDVHRLTNILREVSFPYLSFIGFIGLQNALFANGLHKEIVRSNLIFLICCLIVLSTVPTLSNIVISFVVLLGLVIISYLIKAKDFFGLSYTEIILYNKTFIFTSVLYGVLIGKS